MIVATLDTGALIAMERRKQRGVMLLKAAREYRAELVTLTPVVSEWWRGRSDVRERIVSAITIVPFPMGSARAAGVALGKVRTESVRAKLAVDMMVVAFAALYGGALVYTSDVSDLQVIADRHFPSVRVLGV